MDWLCSILPMTPDANLYDAAGPNVKGDFKTKFAIANWAAYSNMKATMVNPDAGGHIFDGKHKCFDLADIMQMMGSYIIDGLAPSPQLQKKMQSQDKQRTHGNNFIASRFGSGYQQKY